VVALAIKEMKTSLEPGMTTAQLEFLVEAACLGPLTVIATEPATDVASLLLTTPETLDDVRIVWLGGSGDEVWRTSWTP
jgi:inosine-uridine nucleoside N-ribohydrolase